MTRNMRPLLVAGMGTLAVLGCESREERQARLAEVARTRIAAESARASAAPAVPSMGAWTEAQLVKRLVDAGLAPQRRDSATGPQWMGVPVVSFTLGVAVLDAYVYHDSTARLSIVARLDPVTLAPTGRESHWGVPRELIQNGNLLAVVTGGTDRQRDRIATALAAGVGAP